MPPSDASIQKPATPIDDAVRALFELGADMVIVFHREDENGVPSEHITATVVDHNGDEHEHVAPTADECVTELARKLVARRAR